MVPKPKVPFSDEEAGVKEMTEKEYDLEQWQGLLKNTAIQLAIMLFLHYKWAVTVPLLTQLVLSPIKMYTNELVQAYFFNVPTVRPFPVPPSPFGQLLGGGLCWRLLPGSHHAVSELTGNNAQNDKKKKKPAKPPVKETSTATRPDSGVVQRSTRGDVID